MKYSDLEIEAIKLLGRKELTEVERKELSNIFTGHYACERVWEAWQYGTMTESDFSPLEEDENIYDDLFYIFNIPHLEDLFRVAEEKGLTLSLMKRDIDPEYCIHVYGRVGMHNGFVTYINPYTTLLEQDEETLTKLINLFK